MPLHWYAHLQAQCPRLQQKQIRSTSSRQRGPQLPYKHSPQMDQLSSNNSRRNNSRRNNLALLLLRLLALPSARLHLAALSLPSQPLRGPPRSLRPQRLSSVSRRRRTRRAQNMRAFSVSLTHSAKSNCRSKGNRIFHRGTQNLSIKCTYSLMIF